MPGDVNLESPPVLGLGAEQLIELLETFHAQVPSRPDLQGDDSGVVGPGAGHPEVLIPQCLPGCSCSHVGLEGYRELHQVHGLTAPEDDVRLLVGCSNVLGEAVGPREVSSDLELR